MDIQAILDDHKKWLLGQGGKRADLKGANLEEANLEGADLRWANLEEASLEGTCLQEREIKDWREKWRRKNT